MVTAEAAVVLPVLVALLALALGVLACVAAELRCVDAARSAARLAARGDPAAAVRAVAVAAGPPGAAVDVTRAGAQVVVVVRVRVRLPGLPVGLVGVDVQGRAAALDETSVGVPPGLPR